MAKPATRTPQHDDGGLLTLHEDRFFQIQRKLGLAPADGQGFVRRALFWSMLAWLPLVIWAAITGHLTESKGQESLLLHFGVHVRCLIAIPLFILAEKPLQAATHRLLPYFVDSGIVTEKDVPRFREILRDIVQIRDAFLPLIVILGLIAARATLPLATEELHELAWAGDAEGGEVHLGFGGGWFLYVSRSIFLVLALTWMWRLILLGLFFERITRLDLALVPTHPDGAAGLGFIEEFPKCFTLVVFAFSAVAASKWAHGVIYHQESVLALKTSMIGFALGILIVFLAPYLIFAGTLIKARKQGLLDYGKLIGQQGRLVKQRWIQTQPVDEVALLSAPEIGPVTDAAAIYASVKNMRALPIGTHAIVMLAVPLAIPLLALLAVQVPIKEILLTVLKTLA